MKKRILLVVLFFIISGGIYNASQRIVLSKSSSKNEYLESLYNKINHPEKNIRDNSYIHILKSGNNSVDFLLKKLRHEKNDVKIVKILTLIGAMRCLECEQKILPFVDDSNWKVRFFALETLALLNYKDFSALTRNILIIDQDKRIKKKAILLLSEFGDSNDILFLKKLADGKYKDDEMIRNTINSISLSPAAK